MDESLHNIDDLFYNELEGYKETPSARAWDEITHELDHPAAPGAPTAPVRSFRILKVALVFVMMVSGYALNKVVVSRKSIVVSQKQDAAVRDQVASDKGQVTSGREQVAVSSRQVKTDQQNLNIIATKTHQQPAARSQKPFESAGSQHAKTDQQNLNIVATKTHQQPVASSQKPVGSVVSLKSLLHSPVSKNDLKTSAVVATETNPQPPTRNIQAAILIPFSDDNLSITKFITTKTNPQPATGNPQLISGSQQPFIKLNNKKQLSIAAFFAPSFTWSSMQDHEEHRPGGWGGRPHEDHHDIQENEKAGFSFTAGARLRLELGKNWSAESGLSYTAANTKQEPKKLYAEHDDNGAIRYRLNCSAGYTYVLPESSAAPAVGDSILMNSSGYAVQYLNIPVLAGYSFGKGRLRAGLIAGPQFNVLLNGKSSVVLQQNTNSKTTVASSIQGLKKLTTDMVAGISADYRIAPRLSLNLSPQGRISLSSINQGGTVISKTGAFNLSAGLRYYF